MRRIFLILATGLLAGLVGCDAPIKQPSSDTPAVVEAPAPQPPVYPELRASIDANLTEELRAAFRAEVPELVGRLADSGKAGMVIADISDPTAPRVASFDGDQTNYAASLPKVAILYAAFVEIDRGVLVLDDTLRDQMTRMIRNSSNEAATTVFRRVGAERIAEILQAEPWRLYDPAHGGGLWVGRDYGGEVWKRDPVAGQSHGASAMQVARFYYLLSTRQLVSGSSTDEMLEILSKPAIRHKFVIGLADENPNAQLYRKSGTWKQFHADSALVVDPGYRYIVVALVEDEDGAAILEKFVGIADRVIAGNHLKQEVSSPHE